MNIQLVTGDANKFCNPGLFQHAAQLPRTEACSPAFEVIRVVNADIIFHISPI